MASMRRSMSYRKPVPEYIPSPPSSPMSPPMNLVISSDADNLMPPLPDQWRSTIQQVSTETPSNTTLDEPSTVISGLPEPQVWPTPLIKVESVDAMESNETTHISRSATGSPASAERPTKRRLHQQYRPPTPPLPTHHKKRRLPDNQSYTVDAYDVECFPTNVDRAPPLRLLYRAPSMKTASFSTIGTKSPSIQMFQTEKTYSSFGTSEPSTLWSSTTTTYAGSDAGHRTLPVLPMHVVGIQLSGPKMTAKSPSTSSQPSWWDRMGTWGTSFRTKLRSFTNIFIC